MCALFICLKLIIFVLSTHYFVECLFAFALNVFFFSLLVFIISFMSKIQKVWSTLFSFVSKYVLPCIYEHNLFPMHLYHWGGNFEIYVTIVNRSSTLSWMTSEWFCWSWDMHRLVPIYLPTLLLLLKELTKCKSPNEKRYWVVKACRTY